MLKKVIQALLIVAASASLALADNFGYYTATTSGYTAAGGQDNHTLHMELT
jgi:hypothetical protein